MTARPTHPDQPTPQMIRASGLVAGNQARDMIEAIGEYVGAPAPDSLAVSTTADSNITAKTTPWPHVA